MPGRSARELWLHAVKNRNGTMSGGPRKTVAPSRKTPVEYWVGSLRKSSGTQETGATDTFSGTVKRPLPDEVPYLSTSHHLREKVGVERPRRSGSVDPSARPAPGTPAYKSPEEYYDEVLELRRQLAYAEKDSTLLRARFLRLEQDNQRKDKELEQLLDPTKADDLRRALSDRRSDSGATVHSLKQKVLKLEQQLKDKDASYNTLKSNIKNTRIEELNLQMEMMYQEIVRLQNQSAPVGSAAAGGSSASANKDSKENAAKLKALNDTVLRMNDKNVRLTLENKTLKADLEKLMAQLAKFKDEAEHHPKNDIREAIASLENKMSKTAIDDSSSIASSQAAVGKSTTAAAAAAEGKLLLEGTLEQRLDALDKRETALLAELKKLNDVIKRLKGDRQHFRQKAEERSNEVKTLKKEVDSLTAEIQALRTLERVKTPPPRSSASPKPETNVDKSEAPRSLQPSSGRSTPKPIASSRTGDKQKEDDEEERQRKIEKFSKDRAARKLQNGWMQYQQRRHDKEADEAAVTIQSILRGHSARLGLMSASEDESRRSRSTDLDRAALTIQSALRAHAGRHEVLNAERPVKSALNSAPSPGGSRSWSPKVTAALSSRGDDSDDAIVTTPKSSLSRSSSRSGTKSPLPRHVAAVADDDLDDDDDIMF